MKTEEFTVPELGTILTSRSSGEEYKVVELPKPPFGCTLGITSNFDVPSFEDFKFYVDL